MKITVKNQEFAEQTKILCSMMGIEYAEGMEVEGIENSEQQLRVVVRENKAQIYYPTKTAFFRGLTLIKENLGKDIDITEPKKLDLLGYMIDCSRNAVYTLDTVKKIIRQIALMGYDYLMLYCEDTTEVKEYPMLGHLRSRYSHEEIKEIVAYGKFFGIELVPCIQTLAHLNGLLKWKKHRHMADVNDILLVDDDETYEFIDTLIRTMRDLYETEKIHVGMDEAFLLGRGKYLNIHGAVPEKEMFTRHMNRVVDICNKYGFTYQMMWAAELKKELIPDTVHYGMWNYYFFEKKPYLIRLQKAQKLTENVFFADSAYRCTGLASTVRFSFFAHKSALAACDEAGIKHVLVTAWGDGGAEGTIFSPLPILQQHSEYAYSHSIENDEYVSDRLETTLGYRADAFLDFDYCNLLPGTDLIYHVNPGTNLLYNDVLCGVMDKHVYHAPDATEYLKQGIEHFANCAKQYPEYAYAYKVQENLCRVLELKWNMGVRLTDAYLKGDKEAMKRIAETEIPTTIQNLKELYKALQNQWYTENKKNGFDVQDIRFGGLERRLQNVKDRIERYLDGTDSRIEELEVERQFYDVRPNPETYVDWMGIEHNNYYTDCHLYNLNVTANMLFGN